MRLTGTYFNYYQVCLRKLWLFANGIHCEHTSELVYDGKLIHESSYPQRPTKYEEVELEGIKVDFYDVKNRIIHEIKKSDKIEPAHEWQLKYYMYVFEQHGIKDVKGMLEYPTLKKIRRVELTGEDIEEIKRIESKIMTIIRQDECPSITIKRFCKQCSYYEFCFTNESIQ